MLIYIPDQAQGVIDVTLISILYTFSPAWSLIKN